MKSKKQILKMSKEELKNYKWSDLALDSLATSLKFVDEIESEEKKLQKESIKTRRKDLSKKWANFRKREGKKFDSTINRKIVDSINRALEGEK